MEDSVKSPAHYAGDGVTDCKTAMRSMMAPNAAMPPASSYWWGCAFKYLWRWNLKNGVEDLMKCRECVGYLIEEARS